MEFTKDDYQNASMPLPPAFARPLLHIMPSAITFHFANNSDTIHISQKDLIGKCITFAELPQILHKSAFYLRNFRKCYTKVHFACGISANMIQKRILLAEFPQILCKSVFCLRNFRKYNTKTFLACGTSANSMQFKNTPYYIITPFAR